MSRPKHEMADVIQRFGTSFSRKHNPNAYQLRVLGALSLCRTSALGGHKYRCDNCHRQHISYNSCRNRHCPKCQVTRQQFWVDDRINHACDTKHYHMVFTTPKILNSVCMLNSRWFYNELFAAVWETLRQFGYTHFGVEPGAICVLHTWGQNLSLHPHIHCIVPALGFTLQGRLKQIGKNGKYLFPVKQLSLVFKAKLMIRIQKYLLKQKLFSGYKKETAQAWQKHWVVFCEPSLGKPERVIAYLGSYTHRVAITNQRIIDINQMEVTFSLKDYCDGGKIKAITLKGEEFLRRFCLHILPKGFVKIRHYGIYSTRFRSTVLKSQEQMIVAIPETIPERIKRVSGIDVRQCNYCKKGRLVLTEVVPRSRSPAFAIRVLLKTMKQQ
jgi:Putative transposase/Transposase zinc-binding domain